MACARGWTARNAHLRAVTGRGRAARRDQAVKELTDAGISYRDVSELLGLSHQRVAQIAKAS